MRVLVTGSLGMLGRVVTRRVGEAGHDAIVTSHDNLPIEKRVVVKEALLGRGSQVVINCAGRTSGSVEEMMLANAVGPHILAEECESLGIRMIHISTDCVFSGVPEEDKPMRRYLVEDRPDPITPYGRSKLAGEPMLPNVLVVRTSFVGLTGGLGRWLIDQKGEVEGWSSAMWSGTSVSALASFLVREAVEGSRSGLHNVCSAEKVSKSRLLQELVDIFELDVTVKAVPEPRVDRALFPTVELPPLRDALRMLKVG